MNIRLYPVLIQPSFGKGSEKSATGAKVSWQQICHPKSESGLEIKDLKAWDTMYSKESLGRAYSIRIHLDCIWSKLLKLKTNALSFIKHQNGEIT